MGARARGFPGNVRRVIPDDLPAAPGELTAEPGEPLLPMPEADGPIVQVGDRPNALAPDQMGFTPRRAVPWLSPVLLSGTAVRVVLADLFGAYLDKRELQDSMPDRVMREAPGYSGFAGDLGAEDDAEIPDGELWVDYCADTGDGFNATYSVAYLLAQRSLSVEGHELPRGEVLVLGGDQVYPTASGQQYEDRFKGPFRAAFPDPPAEGPRPRMYAVPGNHDWYDGLTAFLRLFVRGGEGKIGGWQTRAVPVVLRDPAAQPVVDPRARTCRRARTSTIRSCATSTGWPRGSAPATRSSSARRRRAGWRRTRTARPTTASTTSCGP